MVFEVHSTAQAELSSKASVAVHFSDDLRHKVVDRQSLEVVQVLIRAQLSSLESLSRLAEGLQRVEELLCDEV